MIVTIFAEFTGLNMIWVGDEWKKVGRMKHSGRNVVIEIDGDRTLRVLGFDVFAVVDLGIEIPVNDGDESVGTMSLSNDGRRMMVTIPVGGQEYSALVKQVRNMMENPEKKAAVWVFSICNIY